ncbi:hypothetical protein Y1Q_0010597 [Alligator mississippiensis]|uniref:Ig-like domain-containing protein n=1 Tax=Alligator mississippiensis TaxID=8496 RepID=A0A151PGS9_ALLMI|nr:hypothetical protein Y1Q_0010597 [Alligator mississippiensis]
MEIQPGLLWAVTALVLLAGSSLEDKVTQRQKDASGVERGAVTLDCTYETRESYYNLYWYKQSPGGSLVFLLWQYSEGAKERAAMADAIQSAAAQVSAAEGGTVTLRCSYNTSYNVAYYLYWYRRYPNRTLQYLLYRGAKTAKSASSTADFARERFSSETDDTSTELKIITLELADSAVYHCALQEAQRESDKGELYKNSSCLHQQVGALS